jgi:hypothetical protein
MSRKSSATLEKTGEGRAGNLPRAFKSGNSGSFSAV